VHVHAYTRASPTNIIARKNARGACRTKVRGQVGEDRRACPARSELNGPRAPRQADCRARRGTPRRFPREDPRAEVGEEVRVGVRVRVRVGPVEFKLYPTSRQSRGEMPVPSLLRDLRGRGRCGHRDHVMNIRASRPHPSYGDVYPFVGCQASHASCAAAAVVRRLLLSEMKLAEQPEISPIASAAHWRISARLQRLRERRSITNKSTHCSLLVTTGRT